MPTPLPKPTVPLITPPIGVAGGVSNNSTLVGSPPNTTPATVATPTSADSAIGGSAAKTNQQGLPAANSSASTGGLRMIPQVPIQSPQASNAQSSPIAQAPPRMQGAASGVGVNQGVGDKVSSNMIKPLVGRPLPIAGGGSSAPNQNAIAGMVSPPNAGGTQLSVVDENQKSGEVNSNTTSPNTTNSANAQQLSNVKERAGVGTPPPQTVAALSSVSSSQVPVGAGGAPPAPTTKSTPAPKVEFAKPKKSPLVFIPIIIGVLLIAMVVSLGVIFLRNQDSSSNSSSTNNASNTTPSSQSSSNNPVANNSTNTTDQKTVLQYWGLWEPGEAFQQVIDEYQAQNPNISIQYTKQSHIDYRSRLQNAIASGNGPDVFRYHATWVPMLKSDLSSLPSSVMSASEFQQTFYPVAIRQLQNNGTPVGIPLMYDGLVLFYNEEIFSTAVEQPPSTWSEVRALAKKLRLPQDGGKLERASIAMGTTANVEHFADILAILSLQNGADLNKPSGKETIDALSFYTLFAKEGYWDDTMPNSTTAFARGDVAMMFAPSWRAHDIKQMNPNLKFATVPIPQLDTNNKISWASYWAEGVSAKSKAQKEAWEFLKYLSTKEVQQKLYNSQSQIRAFGEPYSRVDLASQLIADRIIGAFLSDAPKAQGWYMSSFTHDRGINDEIIKYYEDAVNSISQGRTPDSVIDTLSAGVQSVLQKYGVSSSVSPAQSSLNSSAADQDSAQSL